MKCKKYDQSWFDNKYIQLLNMNCGTTEKKLQKLIYNFLLQAFYDILNVQRSQSI